MEMQLKVGFAGLLTVAFIVLKLCKVIDWSWIWVVSPIWISALIGLIFIVGFIALKIWAIGYRKW